MKPTRALGVPLVLWLALSGCATQGGSEDSAEYPSEDIRLLVPYSAGGPTELTLAARRAGLLGIRAAARDLLARRVLVGLAGAPDAGLRLQARGALSRLLLVPTAAVVVAGRTALPFRPRPGRRASAPPP